MDPALYRYIQTPRLYLVNTSPEILEKVLEGDGALSAFLGIRIPSHWTEFGEAPFIFMQQQLLLDTASVGWWSWLPVLIAENTLAGNCGYKGPPKDGVVEIGYEVASEFRRMGLATEMAQVLVQHAFSYEDVNTVIAHTLPEENYSVRVLKKIDFLFDDIVDDPEDGTVWRWKCPRKAK